MSLLDFILNIAGLLLWVSWRYVPFDPLTKARPATLPGTLRPADPTQARVVKFLTGFGSLLAIVALLLLRAVFYWWIGGALSWTPGIDLGAITLSFRSDEFWRMAVFSAGSFAHALMVFYLWLLLLSLVGSGGGDNDPCHRFVKIQLGGLNNWPMALKVSAPWLLVALVWTLSEPLLAVWHIVPPAQSWLHRAEQGAILGLSVYPIWRYLIAAALGLYLLNTYVYLGNHPFWNYISQTGHRLLTPLKWLPLRLGKVELAPVVGMVLVLVLGELAERGLTLLYGRLPF